VDWFNLAEGMEECLDFVKKTGHVKAGKFLTW
jgi:hypothetical protein